MKFKRNLAVVIGINQYTNGINPLQTAVPDAQKLADILTEVHGYKLIHPDANTSAPLLNTEATLSQLKTLFSDVLPNQIQPNYDDRLFIYFAGHGITRQVDDQGPQGFLVPQDADTNDCGSLLPMSELYSALNQLECRHLFVVLDCCFAGMFRWANTRKVVLVPDEIHWEHYHRFIKYPAWQVITSAAHNQEALDYLDNRVSDSSAQHSPFAEALFEGLLDQKADIVPDGVITAAELYLYLRDYVEKHSNEQQTPGFWPLNKHDRGEYIFQLIPEEQLQLKPAPKLEKDNNPYRGLESFEEKHAELFFGREDVIDELVTHLSEPTRQFTVVDGISGSGKSSLVKAGLISRLKKEHSSSWHIFNPIRPGTDPYYALACAALPTDTSAEDIQQASEALKTSPETFSYLIEAWSQQYTNKQLLLVIDQFEELITLAPKPHQAAAKINWRQITRGRRFDYQPPNQTDQNRTQWQLFIEVLAQAMASCPHLHVLVTLRSDFAPRFKTSALGSAWADARFLVRPMRSDELREAVIGPANEMALYFEPANLVDTLVDEVAQTPGALPLLSFTLSELYLKLHREWNYEGKEDRCLSVEPDFYAKGGVAGLLATRANEEYDQLPDDDYRRTMRQVILRMVEIEGSEAVKRRVPKLELLYVDQQENKRVETVLDRLNRARLIVSGSEAGEAYIEPAHDFLVRGWDKLQDWIQQEQETLLLQRMLIPATKNWYRTKRDLWNGNSRLTLLKQIKKSRDNWLNQLETLFVQSSLNRKRLNTGARLGFLGLVAATGTVYWMSNKQLMAAAVNKVLHLSDRLQQTTERLSSVSAQREDIQLMYNDARLERDEAAKRAGREALAKQNAIDLKQVEEKKAQDATQLAQDNFETAQRNAVNQFSATAKLFMNNSKPTEAMAYAIRAAEISRTEGLWEEGTPPSTVAINLLAATERSIELNVFDATAANITPNSSSSETSSEETPSKETSSENSQASNKGIYASTIALKGNTIISGNQQGELHWWPTNTQENKPAQSQEISSKDKIKEIFVTDDADTVAWVESDNSAVIYRVEEEKSKQEEAKQKNAENKRLSIIKSFQGKQIPSSVAIASNSQTIVISTQSGELTVLDNKGKALWSEISSDTDTEQTQKIDTIHSLAISPEGNTVVVAGTHDNIPKLQIWNQNNSDSPISIEDEALSKYADIVEVDVSLDGQNIIVVGTEDNGDSHIQVRDLKGALHNHQLMEIEGKASQLSVTKNGNILAVSTAPEANISAIYLWNINGKRLLNEVVEGEVLDAAIAPDGETIIISSLQEQSNKLHVWEGPRRQTTAEIYDILEVSSKDPEPEEDPIDNSSQTGDTDEQETTPTDKARSKELEPNENNSSETTVDETTADETDSQDKETATDKSDVDKSDVDKTTADEIAENETATSEDAVDETESIEASGSSSNPKESNPKEPNPEEPAIDQGSTEATTDQSNFNKANAEESSDEQTNLENSSDSKASDQISPNESDSGEAKEDQSDLEGLDNKPHSAPHSDDSSKINSSKINSSSANISTTASVTDANTPDIEETNTTAAEDEQPSEAQPLDSESTAHQEDILRLNTQMGPKGSDRALISITPNGKTIAIGENFIADSTLKSRLRVEEVASSSSLLNTPFKDLEAEIHALSISESGKRVVLILKANEQNKYYAKILNVETKEFLEDPVSLDGEQVLVQMSPDGQSFITATTIKQSPGEYSSEVKLWALKAPPSVRQPAPSAVKAKLKRTQTFKGGKISALAISTDGHRLMIAHNKGFETLKTGYNVGGSGTLSVWDISPEAVRENKTSLVKKHSVPTEGYISAIALSSAPQEVALITHHVKSPKILKSDQKQNKEVEARDIISKVKTSNWENQSTSKTLSFEKGQIIEFVGLMPDGENIVVGGHKVVSQTYQSGKSNILLPTIRLLNKQSHQAFDLSWATVLNSVRSALSTETDSTGSDSTEPTEHYSISPEQLTSLAVTTDGKHIFSSILQPKQLGILRWELDLNKLLQKSCLQIQYHPILHNSETKTPKLECRSN